MLFQTVFSQSRTGFELLLDRYTRDMNQAKFQLDSLEQVLEYLGDQLVSEKRDPENSQRSRAEWYQKLKQVSELTEEQKQLINHLQEEMEML